MNEDVFKIDIQNQDRLFTKRGILSTVNSIFDPIGFLAPITIKGKLLLRSLMKDTCDWDKPLPLQEMSAWMTWKESLTKLTEVYVPRCYSNTPLGASSQAELHVFSDASEVAISAAAYLVLHQSEENFSVSFAFGKSKVAPTSGHTIPRLELCAAVLAVQIATKLQNDLHAQISSTTYYTDSKIVLGYIKNTSRRFTRYVSNRVDTIIRLSSAEQWKYVSTQSNPADVGTRGVKVEKLQESMWLTGPPKSVIANHSDQSTNIFPLVDPDGDVEIKKEVKVSHTDIKMHNKLGTERFSKFSSWKNLVNAIAFLMCRAKKEDNASVAMKIEKCKSAEDLILREVQRDSYLEEYRSLNEGRQLKRSSSIAKLNPYLDDQGLMCVGGRLNNSPELSSREKNPVIIPGTQHVATLLTRHYHAEVCHQGRHITEGSIRAAGYWIVGSKRLVSKLIYQCVPCRKYRGHLQQQKMADLPSDRVERAPPFTYVGVDMFGPWHIVSRRTRGGQANSKRWAILFTCLCVRAIHIEVVEDMSASAFLNALRRFISVRGKVKQFRSDCGTNFVGAIGAAGIQALYAENKDVKKFLVDSKATWIFNSPHSSHMGGAWERMIGLARRILDNMLVKVHNLTNEVLVTFMAEVCAIVNSRPLVPVSYDAEQPEILTPAILLTQKTCSDIQLVNPISTKDLYKNQWQRVQHLADVFWTRWRRDYLHTLQSRPKWTTQSRKTNVGDILLIRDSATNRMDWPMGRVIDVFSSDDGLVRKVKVRVYKEGRSVDYVRPVVETVLLLSTPQND